MKKLLALFALIGFSLSTFASHVPGGNITYECLGNNQYLITLTLFEDCGTAFETNADESITIANDCGIAGLTNASLTNTVFQQEVSQLCIGQIGQSECNGGTLPGVYMHQWQGIVTLPADCDSWVFSYSSCCRNTSTNAASSSDNYYWESVLNSQTGPCNSSPVITGQPIPYNCVNQPVIYNFGVYEPDGNTLVYSLIPAATSATGTVTYNGGYSGATPIPGIAIDPNTGEITFTPGTVGNYIVAVLIEEYDANGNLVGSIIQDFQFEVINCAGNNNPSPSATGISNITGSGFSTGPNDVQLCEGDDICFDIEFTDDPGDSVYLDCNVDQLFPGATFTQTGWIGTGTGTICFTVPSGANPFSVISIDVRDNACPVVGVSSMSVGVTVVSSTTAGADETICLGTGVQLMAGGGSNFNWTLISGDPIQTNGANANFSCTNCADPIANPAVTSVYEVTSNLSGGCTNTDQITVNVVPDFNYTLTQSSTTSCLNSDIQLEIVPSIPGNYSYTWSPPDFLDDPNIANPTVTPTTPGNIQYAVEIVSQDGCVKLDTIDLTVASAYAPDATVTTNLTNIMCGDTIYFDTDLGGGVPATCGPSANTACSAAASNQLIGNPTGVNTTTTWPAPFGNWYRNAKHQFLFTAAELQAAGFVGGKITEIAWEVTAINGTTTYNSYQVSMGCTGTTTLTTWESGLTQVMSPQNINIAVGWNTLVLTTAYEWDGISNLVVEVCYDNLATSYTQNSATPWTTTTYNSSLYYRSDSQPACPATTVTTSTNRPVTRFTSCPTIPDPNNYSFEWTTNVVGTPITNATDQNPYSLPVETVDYQLVVTDLNGGCTDTIMTHIDVLCDTCQAPIPVITDVTCFGGQNGEILATPFGINGPPFDLELRDPVTLAILESAPGVATNFAFDDLASGSYLVRSYDTTGCWADTVVFVPEPAEMILTTSQDTIVCIGGTATMNANSIGGNATNYSYIWSGLAGTTSSQNATPTAVTTYDVYALDPMGCSSDTLGITVNMYPPILTTPSASDTVCPGFDGNVDVIANGGFGAFFSYVWSDSDGNTVGMQNGVTVTPDESPETYYVVVTDGCETPAALDSVVVYWYDVPQPLITVDVSEGCYPVEVNFSNDTDPTMLQDCQWYFGDGSSSANCGDQFHSYGEAGVYDVSLVVTSPDGCVGDTTYVAMIEAFEYPIADFGIFPNPITILEPTTTMYDSSSSDVTSFDWSFGANGILGTSTLQNPEVTFPDDSATSFMVELIVTNADGCTDTTENIVVMNGVYSFYVPSAFTPNGDGLNDEFYPQGEGVNPLEYEMYIFDRWGTKIFETTDANKTWDGKHLSAPVEEGVYIWKIITNDIYLDQKHENIGHVTLIR